MAEALVILCVAAGLAARALMVAAQRRHLRAPSPPTGSLPPVSILKPVSGLDAELEANLRSVFAQDYPTFEVIIGAQRADDPALEVARRVARAFPRIPSAVVADPREVGPNPKVANLANLLPHARHDLLLVSDSNTRVPADYLHDLVAHLQQPGVGLVSSPIRGTGARSLAGHLDALLLNTFVMGGVSAVHNLFHGVCVVGKSMLLRRETLRQLGGFEKLALYLAEDQVCGQEVARLGHRVALSSRPVENVVGAPRLRQVASRYLRWGKIRRAIALPGFVGEILLHPVAVAAAGALALRTATALGVLAVTWCLSSTLAMLAERPLAIRRTLPARLVLPPLGELLAAAMWVGAFSSRTVVWRGHRLAIGPRTRLLPLDGEGVFPALEEATERH